MKRSYILNVESNMSSLVLIKPGNEEFSFIHGCHFFSHFSDTYFMLLNAIKTNNTNIIQELVQQFNRDD